MRIRINTEQKQCPAWVTERVARAGGWNRFGEPNYRVVWGWSRLTLIGGEWTDYEHDGAQPMDTLIRTEARYSWVPKYEKYFRWHLEKWMPPEHFGTPESWRRQWTQVVEGKEYLELGPYPARGEYEQAFVIETPEGGYLELNPTTVEYILRAITRGRDLAARNPAQARAAIWEREARKAREWDRYADDVLDDAAPAFGLRPFVTVPQRIQPGANL